jgi:hypothetical protein
VSPLAGNIFHLFVDVRREVAAVGLDMATNGVDGAFADHPPIDINPAHARLGGEGDEGRVQRLQIALAQVKALFCQYHDAAAFRRFIGQR